MGNRIDPIARVKVKEVKDRPLRHPMEDARFAVERAINQEDHRADQRVFGSRKTVTEGIMQFSFDEWIEQVKLAR